MGYVPTIDAFYVPGIKGFSKLERDYLDKYHPSAANTEGGSFFFDDLRTNYYISRSSKEKAVVIGLGGLNSQQLLNPDQVKRMNDNGITLIWMTLPRPTADKPFMQDFEKLCRGFLTSRSSPIFGLTVNDVPFFLATHSTSGAILLKLMHETETRRKLSATFFGAAYVAPFLDVPFASDEQSFKIGNFRPLHWLFEKYADSHKNDRVTDLPIVKRYLTLMEKGQDFLNTSADTSPTFGQIREIQAYSRAMRKNFDPRAASALRSVFMAGDNDPFTCYKTTKHLAQKIPGATFELAHGAGHDPVYDHPEFLKILIDRLNDCVAIHEERHSQYIATPYDFAPLYGTETFDDLIKPSLRDRARLALKSSTGALNTLTSFL